MFRPRMVYGRSLNGYDSGLNTRLGVSLRYAYLVFWRRGIHSLTPGRYVGYLYIFAILGWPYRRIFLPNANFARSEYPEIHLRSPAFRSEERYRNAAPPICGDSVFSVNRSAHRLRIFYAFMECIRR